jgi:hypothetical protein
MILKQMEFNSLNIFLFIIWLLAVISLILIIICRKKINKWLRYEKRNRIIDFNIENYYKLDLGEKKYYCLKSSKEYLKTILDKEDLELVVIEELNKIIILQKDEKIDIDDIIKKHNEPKIRSLIFKSDIEMVEIKPTKPSEIIINI